MSPFEAPGQWLRCALHAHTTNSDGELAPELLGRHYEWAGYDVLAITGIEVWNTGCELELGRGDSSLHWDEALEGGRPFYALATDDSHHPGYDSGFAWTWVRAAEKSHPKNGRILERDEAGLITAARLERPFRQPYGRVEVAAANGTKAWTNPLWIA